jgi:hypothetical protein
LGESHAGDGAVIDQLADVSRRLDYCGLRLAVDLALVALLKLAAGGDPCGESRAVLPEPLVGVAAGGQQPREFERNPFCVCAVTVGVITLEVRVVT